MQADLPVLEGGITVPNIQAELFTMATLALKRWASGSTGAGRTFGDIIMARWQGDDVYLTPMFDTMAKDTNYYGSTMLASGAAVVRSMHGDTLSAAVHRLVRD
ncbi:hypothetical protein PsorP6_001573 [Peronosclerospora sorghi]|uniref:Uncharacterized protein n=1 Tax=Peronosclerospora sorghi TaxID=230839 RepID=A0ACC0WTZ0_9STRA|nr:hypothetical protein PsorP6_001573 [Peronosclerospora sorghi]